MPATEPTTYRLDDWSTTDLADARMRARKDAVEVLADKETFLGETAEQAVRAAWDGKRRHYSIEYLALVVGEVQRQVNRAD